MSGICGLFNLDQAPAAEADLAAMLTMLGQRGPDSAGQWHGGGTGLGHALLTTPGSLREAQPFRHADSGCIVTADARLDYRDALIGALGLSGREPPGDAELIIEAYLAWGEDAPRRLFGDFAFAIWDPREERLFCARDRFALRPFYYHHAAGTRFLFASDARAILVLPQVPFRINEARVADFLVEELEWLDYTSTFYRDVHRLPPAHSLTVTRSGVRIAEYWAAEPGPAPGCRRDEEFREGFLEVFTDAVAERLRGPGPSVGSMLSGGMDSGAIVAVAHAFLEERGEGPLNTYSLARRRDEPCVESRRIYATLDHLGLTGTRIAPNEYNDSLDVDSVELEEPFDGEFLFLRAIYGRAHSNGDRAVLDGAAGDLVFNEGPHIVRLLRRGRLIEAWRETIGEAQFWETGGAPWAFARHLGAAFTPALIKKLLRGPRSRMSARACIEASLIDAEFARRVDVEERFERMRANTPGMAVPDPALARVLAIRPNLTAGRERYARIAAAAGIEARDPFTDLRVAQFCAHLPDHLCAHGGWPKILLREAMAGRLPDTVRWGRGKPHIGGYFNLSFIGRERKLGHLSLDQLTGALGGFIDPIALRRAWRAFEAGIDWEPVHSAYVLSLWLRRNVNRPVVKARGFG